MKSITDRCNQMWHGMRYRCRHDPAYENIFVKMTKLEFVVWAVPRVQNFLYFQPNGIPTVDRLDPLGHYELGNIRIYDHEDNRIRSRFISSYLRLHKYDDEEDRIRILSANIIATCRNGNIDRKRLLSYLQYCS